MESMATPAVMACRLTSCRTSAGASHACCRKWPSSCATLNSPLACSQSHPPQLTSIPVASPSAVCIGLLILGKPIPGQKRERLVPIFAKNALNK